MDDSQVLQAPTATAIPPLPGLQIRRHFWRGALQGSEYSWALAFGMAVMMTALPPLIPVAILVLRKRGTAWLQL